MEKAEILRMLCMAEPSGGDSISLVLCPIFKAYALNYLDQASVARPRSENLRPRVANGLDPPLHGLSRRDIQAH